NGDAEIDVALPASQAEAAILGNAVLRDVEIRHHLDARDERGLIGRIEGAKGVHQYAVDAEIDRHAGGFGMDVDIARLPLQRGADDLVDEPHHRGRIAAEGFKIDGFGVALLGLANKGKAELGAHLLQHLLAVVASLKNLIDGVGGADNVVDFAAAQEAELLLELEIVGPACRDDEQIAFRPERYNPEPPRVGCGKTRQRLGGNSHPGKIVEGQAEPVGCCLRGHLMRSVSVKIGRYIAMTTQPTRTPASRSTAGSIMLVSLDRLVASSSSCWAATAVSILSRLPLASPAWIIFMAVGRNKPPSVSARASGLPSFTARFASART